MIFRYSNDNEDKDAIELINQNNCSDFDDLKTVFREHNLPLRETYVFYFISKQHQNDPIERGLWGIKSSKYQNHKLLYYWWEHYLEYEREIKLKLRAELFPELPELGASKSYDLNNLIELHPEFIKKGYEYLDKIKKYIEEIISIPMEEDFDNQKYTSASNTPSLSDINAELDRIKEEFTYELVQIKKVGFYNTGWCPACSESPCMCSDPY